MMHKSHGLLHVKAEGRGTSACCYVRFSSQLTYETNYKRKGGRHCCCKNKKNRLLHTTVVRPGSHDSCERRRAGPARLFTTT
ncbi:hypothetical protein PAMP_008475 [Pampus punctatissimus]